LTISNPVVQIDGNGGSLIADVSSLSQDGELAESPGVVLGDLDVSGTSLEPDSDGAVSAEGISAVLTDAGAPAFGGFYDAGEALDPVGFTVQTSAGEQDTDNAVDNTSDQTDTGNESQVSGDDASDDTDDTSAAAQDEDALPKTGAPWELVAVGGLVLVAIGTAFVLLGRRRVTSSARQ
jgi:LPXTG-motif cell wall-anchored protein